MDAERSATRARRMLRQALLALLAGWALSVIAIEVLSRVADGVLAARRADPSWKPAEEPAGLWERLAHDTLVYGSPRRAQQQVHGARNQPHPYLGYAPRPLFRTLPGTAPQAAHNSLGYRGRETTWEKPPGVFRILTIGGSSVYGQSESCDEAVWSEQLERMLGEARPDLRCEVINAGVSGWSSFEMLIDLQLRSLDLSPDLVLVYEAINDMRCALYKRGGPPTRDNLHWRTVWPVDRTGALERVLEHSRTYLFWRRWFTPYVKERADLGFFGIRNYDPNQMDLYWDYADGQPSELGFQNYRRNLLQIVATCRARGAQVIFATQALARWHLDLADSRAEQLDAFARIQATQRELARELDVPVCDSAAIVEAACQEELAQALARAVQEQPGRSPEELEAELRRMGRRDLLFFSEVHPNDRGSALLARTIADWLLTSGLLPGG